MRIRAERSSLAGAKQAAHSPDEGAYAAVTASRLVREAVVLQVKLILEGFKDVFLGPVAIGAVLLDLVFRDRHEKPLLYSLLERSERFEQLVNLYGALSSSRHP